ncbi:MAG TPA: methyltransferase, partial [Acetobacteraceae bacterium]|nr:methyltransferase [Acetobacteraceae bacterium]
VPIAREMPGPELAKLIQRDGTIVFNFDGLRAPIALPPQAAAILPLVDGRRTVAAIGAELAPRGIGADAFARSWAATYGALVAVNRVLLAPPA